jgi:hypothetical protein
MITILLALAIVCGAPAAQVRPDFSGTWTFDQAKTMPPGPDGRVVLAAMLGDRFVALQNEESLTLRITFNGEMVVAVYDLTGAESENVSPGDIRVRSRASWQDRKLVIHSVSQGLDQGKPATIETNRTIWLDENGDLIVERTGTPAAVVTASRSVYRRLSAARPPSPGGD